MTTTAATVQEYLDSLTDEQRSVLEPVRSMILSHLSNGFEETMNWGVISYEVPLERYPKTYNKKPLNFAGLAAQKNSYSLYLMPMFYDQQVYQRVLDGFQKIGKKPNAGKGCIRFKKPGDLPLEVIGDVIATYTVESYLALYEASRITRRSVDER